MERKCFQLNHVENENGFSKVLQFIGHKVEKVYDDTSSEFTYKRVDTHSHLKTYDAVWFVFYSETDNFHKEAMKAERLATGITEGIIANRSHPKYLRKQVGWGFEDPFEGMDEPDEISSIEEI